VEELPDDGDIFTEAKEQIDAVRQWAVERGYACSPLPSHAGCANLGIPLGETSFAALSIMPGTPSLYLTAGVLHEIRENRRAALEAANSWTRGNPDFPCFFADAPDGGDLIIQVKFPLQVLNDAPDFVQWCIENLELVTSRLRDTATDLGVGGQPFRQVDGDIQRLLVRGL
jgi:hypothetical protein